MQNDFDKARREMTGNMPTGEYRMDKMEFRVTRRSPENEPATEDRKNWKREPDNEVDYTWFLI